MTKSIFKSFAIILTVAILVAFSSINALAVSDENFIDETTTAQTEFSDNEPSASDNAQESSEPTNSQEPSKTQKPSEKSGGQVPTGDVISFVLIIAVAVFILTALSRKSAY